MSDVKGFEDLQILESSVRIKSVKPVFSMLVLAVASCCVVYPGGPHYSGVKAWL